MSKSRQHTVLVCDVERDELRTETLSSKGRQVVVRSDGEMQEGIAVDNSDYEVIKKLNKGGMGVIYEGTQTSLKREVAIKVFRSAQEFSPEASIKEVDEFTNEAYITANLDHPNIVPVYAMAKDAEGRPFFAMKRVSGVCWKDILHAEKVKDPERRRIAQQEAAHLTWLDHVRILLKVCDAVAFGHSKYILHRDLKPENIMIGAFGEVYVMDWGLALYFDERNEYKQHPELKPELAGTPNYMAPEMADRYATVHAFQQALEIWPDNQEALNGLKDALVLHIQLSVEQKVLTLAKAHLGTLESLAESGTLNEPDALEHECRRLRQLIAASERSIQMAVRQNRKLKMAAGFLFSLVADRGSWIRALQG